MTLPDPVSPKASGGVMAEGKEASCERGSASQGDCSAKDANRRDEIQEITMADVNAELVAALKPFAAAFEKARDKYAKRYRDHELGYRNFDKMPDEWAMDSLEFNMGAFRAARAALSKAEAESAGKLNCACGAMSEQDCHDLPSLRHCGGATSAAEPPCGDPSCNQDRERRMVRTGHTTASGKPVFCDPCIAPIVTALNDAGIHTVASCCGHGYRPGRISLEDGRELFVLPSYEAGQELDATFPLDINGRRRPNQSSEGSNG